MWYESLMVCISAAASLIAVRSPGRSFEHDIASLMTGTKQSLILLLILLSVDSICSQIVESTISKMLLLSACLAYLCRSNMSPNMSSVGLLPVNISSNNIPRLYTSPIVETAEPSPYSKRRNQQTYMISDHKFHMWCGACYKETPKEFQLPGAT